MKVLVADDSATVREAVSMNLRRWDYEIVTAPDGAAAWEVVSQPDAPRLVLLDWEMPAVDGFTLCRRIREREASGAPYTYLLLLTGHGQEHLVAGMDAGADDYVVKPFDVRELRARLQAGRRIVDLQSTLYRLRDQFREQARTDPLTGCLNRRAIMERLAAELARAQRERQPLSVAVLDLDHFKKVNDQYGHAAGDAVLRELTRRLGARLRVSDSFGRIGGEEFLVLWPHANDPQVAADRLRVAVAGSPFLVADRELPLTASLGVATTLGYEPAEAVLARADEALYRAKAAGRDRAELSSLPRVRLAAVAH